MLMEANSVKCLLISMILLVVFTTACEGTASVMCTRPGGITVCGGDGAYCCGANNDQCCNSYSDNSTPVTVVSLLIVVAFLICCPVLCYRCCCRRTVRRGVIYNQAPGVSTSVAVSLPPQQMPQGSYPNMMPYQQQMPYPPHAYTNPYYTMPQPGFVGGQSQAGFQQASAPPSGQYPR